MAIIEQIKLIIGYYETDLDWMFAILSFVLVCTAIHFVIGILIRALGLGTRR